MTSGRHPTHSVRSFAHCSTPGNTRYDIGQCDSPCAKSIISFVGVLDDRMI
jgi:hypothetical protein